MESVSASAATIRTLHHNPSEIDVSQPSSPRSSALPSPPDSPSDSVSSFPSVSSSFFFSSAAASPPHSHPQSDGSQGLIIPSLTLPSALRRPTPYGQTLGEMRLLVLGSQGAGKNSLSGLLVEDNEDVVEIGTWESTEHGALLRASTDWVEHRDAHGLEKFEPTRNIEILEVPGYEGSDDARELVQSLTALIQAPFHAVAEVLDPRRQPSAILANLVSAPSTPFYTALVFILPSSLSSLEQLIIDGLGPQIPIIALTRPSTRLQSGIYSKLSSFRPTSTISLRTGLFRSPETLSALRCEAADRFLRWREVERVVSEIHSARTERQSLCATKEVDDGSLKWRKANWEAEWDANLSKDVARRLREDTVTGREGPFGRPRVEWMSNTAYDPLHLPSLFVFSISILGPLSRHIARSIESFVGRAKVKDYHIGLALVGGFCAGIGIGMFAR